MPRSIVVEVRKAVIEGISEALGDPSIACTYGWRGSADDRRRHEIYTNRPRAAHEPAALKAGRNFRNEQMDFDLVYIGQEPAKTPEQLDELMMHTGQVIEEFLADHKSNELEVPGLTALWVTAFELENQLMATGSRSVAQWTVRYTARLT